MFFFGSERGETNNEVFAFEDVALELNALLDSVSADLVLGELLDGSLDLGLLGTEALADSALVETDRVGHVLGLEGGEVHLGHTESLLDVLDQDLKVVDDLL